MSLCNECDKRHLCTSLCPEAELYAKQDEVPQREKTIGIPIYSKRKWPEPRREPFLTEMERKVANALLDGKTRNQIAQALGITREQVRWHIHNVKKKRWGNNTIYIGIERQETKEIAEEEIPKEAN